MTSFMTRKPIVEDTYKTHGHTIIVDKLFRISSQVINDVVCFI